MSVITIKGAYKKDDNFTTVFTDDTLYTIARSTGNWGCRKVGDDLACGGTLTSEVFDAWKSECTDTGEFELEY